MNKLVQRFSIWYFLVIWFVINLIQGCLMELHVDESYYWVYSRFLDWGYYDHPPMVAVFIKIGTWLSQAEIGVRVMTILTNVAAVYFLWKIVKPYADNIWLFSTLYFSFVIFHVFGFINSPDSPLLFFAVLYLYCLRKYIQEEKIRFSTVFWLAIAITGLLYSKYHGILLIFFTLLAEWRLFLRGSFWCIVAICAVLYLPHILWQVQHDYPSVQYHLFERNARAYQISFTTDYITNLLLVIGPLTGWYVYYKFFCHKSADRFIRILKFIFWGFVLFFFSTSLKSYVQAQWVLLAYIPLFIIGYIALSMQAIPRWFYGLLYTTAGLVMIVRLLLILPIPVVQQLPGVKSFWGHRDLAQQLHRYAGDKYIVFDNGFQDPSSYNFYNKTLKAFSYNNRSYRKTQYDYWPIEDSVRHKDIAFVRPYSFERADQDTIHTRLKGDWYAIRIDGVRLYQKVDITCVDIPEKLIAGQRYPITLDIYNPYDEEIAFGNDGQKWPLYFEYGYTQYIWDVGTFFEFQEDYHHIRIPSKQSVSIKLNITAPTETGDRFLMFSLRTEPFGGPRNSKKYPVYVSQK